MNNQQDTMLVAQNAELKKALAEKTLELSHKTRDLEIEAALERVRSRSLAMHKSDELQEVINTIYEQLVQLDVKMDSVNFIIFYKGRRDFDLWLAEPQHIYTSRMYIPEIDCFPTIQLFDAVEKGVDFFTITCSSEEKNTWYNYAFEHSGLKQTTPERRRRLLEAKYWTIAWAINSHSAVQLNSFSRESFSTAEHDILKRFGKVFEQAYIRFLDVQKAEEQARESQIQLALERVRARTMAMQKSDELKEVIQIVFEQFVQLNFHIDAANFALDYQESDDFNLWVSGPGPAYASKMHVPYLDHPLMNRFLEAKHMPGLITGCLTFEEKNTWFKYFFEFAPTVANERKEFIFKSPGMAYTTVLTTNVSLSVYNYAAIPYSAEENATIMRFGKVFEQTYTRFLDLQKAEEQAHEANIEAALERVRSRTMAMQKSEELAEVIQVIYDQFVLLGFKINNASFNMDYRGDGFRLWLATSFQRYPSMIFTPYLDHPVFNNPRGAIDAGSDHFVTSLTFSERNEFWDHFFKNSSPIPDVPADVLERIYNTPGYYSYGVLMKTVSLTVNNYLGYAYTEAEEAVIMRFGKVFEQTYTRFNDLKQAEEQAREANIEAALERVRSRTMAMQKSEELAEAIQLIFNQFVHLGFNIDSANFNTDYRADNDWRMWIASSNQRYPSMILMPYFDHPAFNIRNAAIDAGSDHFVTSLTFSEKNQLWDHFFKNSSPIPDAPAKVLDRLYNAPGHYNYGVLMKIVSLTVTNYQGYAYTEAEKAVVMRFGKVFEQTYIRFNDLKQAEEQAREAKIEAALEKVRSRSLAMNKTDELQDVVNVVFEKLLETGFNQDSISIVIPEKKSSSAIFWIAVNGSPYGKSIVLPKNDDAISSCFWNAYSSGTDYLAKVFSFEEKNQFFNWAFEHSGFKSMPPERKAIAQQCESYAYSIAFGKVSGIQAASYSGKMLNEKDREVLKRFGRVFEQAYVRFLDLQKAEARAREAIKQASLDRVRAEIASMRSTQDLERIIPLVWNELTTLSIPFIRCGVFIVDEEAELIHTHLSTPDGKALAAFDLAFEAEGIGRDVLPAWRKKQMVSVHWSAEEFATNTKNLVSQGVVKSSGKYVTERPDTTLDLHFFPFLQGMLYVGNAQPLNEDAKGLAQALTEAFSTAYARYEDFNKLEAAKKQVDKTLTELKSTQSQLIQSEKMASLGELTAGIAHEIQNPLNFVNNFSEVNKELLAEMNDEITKGNYDEVKALAKDVIENEEKINHHGKRADAIVKGMLQHSSSSTGVKEPININALADEYLRLSYHGLRAKDKSFNATLKTDFDETIGNINIIPQDIGRVVLNLINNAFYAVNEKKKLQPDGYEPTVLIRTKKKNEKIEITVEDNGNGISKKLVEKIFQPFFTTKPTGQGTGLGLSLSYDIVKAHGGEIKVETKEEDGSKFIIQLPIIS